VHKAELLRTSLPPGCPDVAQRGVVLQDLWSRDQVMRPELSPMMRPELVEGSAACVR